MTKIILVLLLSFSEFSNGFVRFSITSKFSLIEKRLLNAYDPKEEARLEQIKIQQEILARRKNKSGMKAYFKSVEERRKETSTNAKVNDWRKEDDSVDPLTKWKKNLADGKIKKIGYDAEPSKSDSLFGLNIIVPINPIGIPKYDEGERFDLRLPYAERGYEDPDADVLGKLGAGISNLFGGSQKKADVKEGKSNTDSKGNIKKTEVKTEKEEKKKNWFGF